MGAGGLIPLKATSIKMVSEYLVITTHKITVKYVFRNDSDKDIDATVAFPLPDLEGSDLQFRPVELPAPGKINFFNFKLLVDGKPLETKTEIRAFNDKQKDISARLRAEGLPLVTDDPDFQKIVENLPAVKRDKLIKEKVIQVEESQYGENTPWVKKYWQNWHSRVQYYWFQHFPVHREIAVEHTYVPVVGGSYFAGEYLNTDTLKRYCSGPLGLAKIKAAQSVVLKQIRGYLSSGKRNSVHPEDS